MPSESNLGEANRVQRTEQNETAADAGIHKGSFIGMMGCFIEPVLEPLGQNWRSSILDVCPTFLQMCPKACLMKSRAHLRKINQPERHFKRISAFFSKNGFA